MAAELGVTEPPPELTERTRFWMEAFGTAHRTRPAAMGGIPALNPLDLLALRDRLGWPCEADECLQVLCAMDDQWRALQSPGGD